MSFSPDVTDRRPSGTTPPYSPSSGHQYPPDASPALAAPVPRPVGASHDSHDLALSYIPSLPHRDPKYGPRTQTQGEGDEADKDDGIQVDMREYMRTPSPTPTEKYVLTHKSRSCNLRQHFTREKLRDPRHLMTLGLTLLVVILLILFLVYQHSIEDALQPFANWMHDTPGGWLIPIAIMFVLSFPPLFGHEIIAILCGDVWGVWIGFGIVAAGTLLGELGNFYAFKLLCMTRGKKLEETKIRYALLAQVVREGGLKIPVIMRLSVIPGHFATAIFSTIGMSVWVFIAAATLGLPKQLAVVFLGVSRTSGGTQTTKVVKALVITATVIITHIAMFYIYKKMDEVKEGVVYKMRKARQAKVLAAKGYPLPDAAAPIAVDVDLERADDAQAQSQSSATIPMAVVASPAANPFASSRDTVASTAPASTRMQRMSSSPGTKGPSGWKGRFLSPDRARMVTGRKNGENELRR